MLNFNLKKETLLSQNVKSPYYARIGGKMYVQDYKLYIGTRKSSPT